MDYLNKEFGAGITFIILLLAVLFGLFIVFVIIKAAIKAGTSEQRYLLERQNELLKELIKKNGQ